MLLSQNGKVAQLPMRASSNIKISLEFQNYLLYHREMFDLAGLRHKKYEKYFLLMGFL